MYGDFSRVLDPRAQRYTAVWAQQGSLQLDADLNQQTAIVLDYLRTLAIDFIGPFGGHVNRAGFYVTVVPPTGNRDEPPVIVELSDGHYYVYGLRCQSPEPDQRRRSIDLGHHELPLIVELLVWEQTVSSIQDPTLIEPALGAGASDTTRRSQVRWRVLARHEPPGAPDEWADTVQDSLEAAAEMALNAYAAHQDADAPRPELQARAVTAASPADEEDTEPVRAAYRGVENQLYRVEVHSGGEAAHATFKWSRDNGSVELALDSIAAGQAAGEFTAVLSSLWRDARAGLEPGDWVELVDDDWAPTGKPAPLLQVADVVLATRTVTLLADAGEHVHDELRHPFLRRWDQRPASTAEDNAIAVTDAGDADDGQSWFDLEDGVQLRFVASGRHFQRGDYWLIPARTATGGVLWPTHDGAPAQRRPDGPGRYRAPLALITPEDVVDLRTLFTHLAWPDLGGGNDD